MIRQASVATVGDHAVVLGARYFRAPGGACTGRFLSDCHRGRARCVARYPAPREGVPQACTPGRDHVTGVRVANRQSGADEELDADLVVDSMGRGSRTPTFLERLGYERPVENSPTPPLSAAKVADLYTHSCIRTSRSHHSPTGQRVARWGDPRALDPTCPYR
jgi:hypothetical protein